MMPNMDPRAMRSLMAKMGIKSSEIAATKVTIELEGKQIIVSNPQVTRIEAQGVLSFQVTGDVSEVDSYKAEITEDDIKTVSDQTGITDQKRVRDALEAENGDIAKAIIRLNGSNNP